MWTNDKPHEIWLERRTEYKDLIVYDVTMMNIQFLFGYMSFIVMQTWQSWNLSLGPSL
jgi:hypothetical protein